MVLVRIESVHATSRVCPEYGYSVPSAAATATRMTGSLVATIEILASRHGRHTPV